MFRQVGRAKRLHDANTNMNLRFISFSFIHELFDYQDILEEKGSVMYFLYKEFQKAGYTISFSLFNSANYGVPQKRERVIIFGHKGKRIPLPSPTHSESGVETGKKWAVLKKAFAGLNSHDHVNLSEKTKKYMTHISQGEYWKHLPEDIKEEAMGASYYLGGGKTGFYRRLSYEEPSPTLVTSPAMPATLLVHPDSDRPLSVQEYARIQQFPDNWIFEGGIREIYKQIGNAVPVGLGLMAGKTIMDFMNNNFDPQRERKNKVPYSRYKNCSDFEFIPQFEKKLKGKKNTPRRNKQEIVSENGQLLISEFQNESERT